MSLASEAYGRLGDRIYRVGSGLAEMGLQREKMATDRAEKDYTRQRQTTLDQLAMPAARLKSEEAQRALDEGNQEFSLDSYVGADMPDKVSGWYSKVGEKFARNFGEGAKYDQASGRILVGDKPITVNDARKNSAALNALYWAHLNPMKAAGKLAEQGDPNATKMLMPTAEGIQGRITAEQRYIDVARQMIASPVLTKEQKDDLREGIKSSEKRIESNQKSLDELPEKQSLINYRTRLAANVGAGGGGSDSGKSSPLPNSNLLSFQTEDGPRLGYYDKKTGNPVLLPKGTKLAGKDLTAKDRATLEKTALEIWKLKYTDETGEPVEGAPARNKFVDEYIKENVDESPEAPGYDFGGMPGDVGLRGTAGKGTSGAGKKGKGAADATSPPPAASPDLSGARVNPDAIVRGIAARQAGKGSSAEKTASPSKEKPKNEKAAEPEPVKETTKQRRDREAKERAARLAGVKSAIQGSSDMAKGYGTAYELIKPGLDAYSDLYFGSTGLAAGAGNDILNGINGRLKPQFRFRKDKKGAGK